MNHIKKVNLPYTVVDVGWWYQVTLPRLPSGRIDYAVMETSDIIAGDGNVPMAVTDLRDVGKYVARIISDPRTLNKMVFAYSEIFTYSQMYDLMEKLSGEKLHRKYVGRFNLSGWHLRFRLTSFYRPRRRKLKPRSKLPKNHFQLLTR